MRLASRIKNKLGFILSTRHRLAKIETFKNYLDKDGSKGCYCLIDSNRKTMVKPVQFVDEGDVIPFEVSLPDTYCAELPSAKVIGGSSVVVSADGILLYDMLAECKKYNANMTDNGLCLIGGRPRHFGKTYIYNYLRGVILDVPVAISFLGNMSNNYYHFMMEVAAKFQLLSNLDIPVDVPLLVDQTVMAIPQMKEVFEVLNSDHRPVIIVMPNQLCMVGKLYIISEPNVIVPNSRIAGSSKTENFAFDGKAIAYLRDTLISNYGNAVKTGFPSRVFLSRKGCNKRRCNEDELEPILKKFGFEIIQSEKFSVAQQIQLFSNAEHIIGGSGAAFTNLIFCKAGTIATLFFTTRVNATCFSSLGLVRGVQTDHIVAKDDNREIHQESYTISPEMLHSYLKNIYC